MLLLALCTGGFTAMQGGFTVSAAAAATPTPAPSAAATSLAAPAPSSTPGATPTPVTVTIDATGFHPTTVRVYAGQAVTWSNADKTPHTATASDGSWDTGQIDPTRGQALQFFEIGKWDYLDGFNPLLHATLIVVPGPAPGAQ